MRVLFVPYLEGHPGMTMPLVALARMLDGTRFEAMFLAPGRYHAFLRKAGLSVLDLDYTGTYSGGFDPGPFRMELAAYGKFKPDVVIDDTNIATFFATSLTQRPRITIQRAGQFPGWKAGEEIPTAIAMPPISTWPDVSHLGIPQPKNYFELFKADQYIVPGLRSIEVLPEALENDPTYNYSGHLFLDDQTLSLAISSGDDSAQIKKQLDERIEKFFETNKDRKVVFFTLGTVTPNNETFYRCLELLLADGYAVISSVRMDGLTSGYPERFLYEPWLPMHHICSKSDLIVHHCGGATYIYPIAHILPTITIGTGWADRDEVGTRLQQKGASVHVPSNYVGDQFITEFRKTVSMFFETDGDFLREMKSNIAKLKDELDRTCQSFDIADVIDRAARSGKKKR